MEWMVQIKAQICPPAPLTFSGATKAAGEIEELGSGEPVTGIPTPLLPSRFSVLQKKNAHRVSCQREFEVSGVATLVLLGLRSHKSSKFRDSMKINDRPHLLASSSFLPTHPHKLHPAFPPTPTHRGIYEADVAVHLGTEATDPRRYKYPATCRVLPAPV